MRSVSPQASTRRPTTFGAIVPMTRMMATAVRKPSPGTARPNILSNIGANTSSMRLQKIQRSQAVRKTGTVKKKPAMKRTLNQFFTRDDMIESRITPPRPRALITGGARRVGRSEEHTSELQSQSNIVCRLLLEKKKTAHPHGPPPHPHPSPR